MAGESDLTDDALAEGNAGALGLGRVADLEPHAELVGAVIEEKDSEDAVLNDGADELRGAIEEGLQVEGGVERIGHLREVGKVAGLDADVDGVKMRRGIGRGGWAIVAFQLMMFRWRWRRGGHGCQKGMITERSCRRADYGLRMTDYGLQMTDYS